MVDMVLATEMTKHFEHLNKFVSIVAHMKDDSLDVSSNVGHARLNRVIASKCRRANINSVPLRCCVDG